MKSPMVTAADYIRTEDKANYTDMQVLKSAAGYYVGTLYIEPHGGMVPGSRDSFDYFRTPEEAEDHLAAIAKGNVSTRMMP
jgi:hypothetical protein